MFSQESKPSPSAPPAQSAEARLRDLEALPLYLQLAPGEVGLTPTDLRGAWPEWRAALRAQHPRQRAGGADLLLLNGLLWAPGMLHLACAFVLGARLQAGLRFVGTQEAPFGPLACGGAVLTDDPDPLPAALNTLQALALDLWPATTLRRELLLRALADRLLQALALLGRVTGETGRAADWADRLLEGWPVPSRAKLSFVPEERLVRATCCFFYLNEGGARCANCPAHGAGRTP